MHVPGSLLHLKNQSLSDTTVSARCREFLSKAGIAPDRIKLTGWLEDPGMHLAAYRDVDIALDTFPYHGTTTTCEALWMGVPVITMAGRTHASQVGVSLLNNVGLPELIASNSEHYVRIAAGLAADTSRLSEIRSTMRSRMK